MKIDNTFRVCYFDIEASNLNSSFGVIISAAIKPDGKEPVLLWKGRNGSDDKELVKKIKDELEKYDLIVGYYHLNFDMKMLNSRLRHWGFKKVQRKLHVDVYRLVRKTFNTHSRRLAAICDFLHVKGKTPLDPEVWIRAALDNDKYATAKIVEHNKWDVIILEEVFDKVKDDITSVSMA